MTAARSSLPDQSPGRRRARGFTLIELVTVLVLVGVLAVVALPRFADRTFDERGLHDAVKAALSHGRHVAVGARRYVCANLTAGSGPSGKLALRMDTTLPESVVTVSCTGAGGTAVNLPVAGRGCAAGNEVCAPAGISLGGGSVIFDPQGRSVTTTKAVQAAGPITVTNQPDITIAGETGLVQ